MSVTIEGNCQAAGCTVWVSNSTGYCSDHERELVALAEKLATYEIRHREGCIKRDWDLLGDLCTCELDDTLAKVRR